MSIISINFHQNTLISSFLFDLYNISLYNKNKHNLEEGMNMRYVCPLIVVDDITRSKEFYIKYLDQEVDKDLLDMVFFKSGFVLQKKKDFNKLVGDVDVTKKSNNFELYFEDSNLKELQAKLKDDNIEIIHEIREQPWQQNVIRFYDIDGNIIEVGEA